MTFTTDTKPCGCSRHASAAKCAACAPRKRTIDRAPTKAKAKSVHINVSQILATVREHLRRK